MPSISSRPSASTMRQPAGRRDRKRRTCGLHLRIRQPDMVEAAGIPSRLCTLSHPLVFAGIARHSALSWKLQGRHCACRLRRGHVCSRVAKIMRSLDEFAGEKLTALERAKLRRTPVVTARAGIWAERDGRRLLSFSCNDYLNLSQHPEVIAAAIEATAPLWRRRRRVAARDRQSSALCRARKPAGAAQGHRGGLRLRLRLSRQYRHHPGAGRRRRSHPDR